MIRYVDAQRLAEKELGLLPPPAVPKYEWIGYKNGGVVSRSVLSADDAMKLGNTKIIEKITVNKDEIDARLVHSRKLEARAQEIWYSALRDDYKDMPFKVFDICYAKAYDDAHSYGWDEVANQLAGVVSFAKKLFKATAEGRYL